MKKVLVLAGLLVVLGVVGAVALGNFRAHQFHNGILEGLEQGGGEELNIVESSFAPGVLGSTSTVVFALEPDVGEDEQPVVSFEMENDIRHGALPLMGWIGSGGGGTPVIATMHTTLALEGEVKDAVQEALGELPTLEVDTKVRASGVGESHVSMKPIRAQGGGEAGEFELNWKGLEGDFVFTADMDKVAGSIESGGLEITSALANFTASSFTWTLDQDTDASGVPVGFGSFSLDSIDFQPILLPAPVVSVKGVSLEQSSRVQGGKFTWDLVHRVESVTAGDEVYGPGVVQFELRDLDAKALADVSESLQQVQKQLQKGEAGAAFQSEVGEDLTKALPKLAAHSPGLEFTEISLTTPEGTVRGKILVNLDGSNAEMLQNPLMAVGALSAKASAEAPAELFASMIDLWARKQVASGTMSVGEDMEETVAYVRDSLIHNLRKQGLVVFDGERYTTRIDWSQGRLTVNGIPVNPMELGMLTANPGSGMSFPDEGGPGGGFGGDFGDGDFPAELGDF